MRPKPVLLPVATTTAVAVPLTTFVPMKQIVGSSVSETGACRPLRAIHLLDRQRLAGERRLADEQILRGDERARRPGSCRRPSRYTMSPGTSSSIGISRRRVAGVLPGSNSSPARSTAVLVRTSARSAWADLFDRNS